MLKYLLLLSTVVTATTGFELERKAQDALHRWTIKEPDMSNPILDAGT